MNSFLPTLEQADAIVRGNMAFEKVVHEVMGRTVHHFGYLLPGYMDFERPLADRPDLKAHELRGLTFVEEADGSIRRHLMLGKFHALNQTAGHMLRDVERKRIVSCTEKLDGSLVRFIPVGGGLAARTKTSFSGPHAQLASKLLGADPALGAFVRDAHAEGLAPVFELLSPSWKIVVPYGEERLRLIQMRDEATGDYIDLDGHPLVARHGIDTASVPDIRTVADLLDAQATARGIEGWVVRFEDGQLMKVKTRWYDDFHDFFFERNRTAKKVLAMVLNETMDDALASMDAADPARAEVEEANALLSAHVNGTVRAISEAVAAFRGDPADNAARKAFTTERRGDPLLGLYMQALKDPSARAVLALAKGHLGRDARREEDARGLLDRLRAADREATATSGPRA